MPVGSLYVEELSATMRGRFAWLGAAVVLLAVGCVATVGTQDTWLDGYGVIAYFLVPLAFVPLAAVFLASPRANRFVESVFTAPVERRNWLITKILGDTAARPARRRPRRSVGTSKPQCDARSR
jgi:hypothetical protein